MEGQTPDGNGRDDQEERKNNSSKDKLIAITTLLSPPLLYLLFLYAMSHLSEDERTMYHSTNMEGLNEEHPLAPWARAVIEMSRRQIRERQRNDSSKKE